MSDDERPKFGHGRHDRPLWTRRDRDGEAIREVLRRAGCREFTEQHGGFVVEGANTGEPGPFLVACGAADLDAATATTT